MHILWLSSFTPRRLSKRYGRMHAEITHVRGNSQQHNNSKNLDADQMHSGPSVKQTLGCGGLWQGERSTDQEAKSQGGLGQITVEPRFSLQENGEVIIPTSLSHWGLILDKDLGRSLAHVVLNISTAVIVIIVVLLTLYSHQKARCTLNFASPLYKLPIQ